MEKDFEAWSRLKIRINKKERKLFFAERDIWLCSIGINIGREEDGKQNMFLRPIIFFKKFDTNILWGIPLTSKLRQGIYHHQFSFNRNLSIAMLFQMRVFDQKRFIRKLGVISNEDFKIIRAKINAIVSSINETPL